jgi:phosphodiesterase/alkaline phosphatase D-like protein
LPSKLPGKNKKPFTIGIGSCFYTEHDGGDAGQAYEALYNNEQLRPDIKFLVGDQVYTDIGLGWYPLNESDCQDRIADHYADSWKYLRSILRRGGSWMISDDHEFWNNYPFFTGFNPYLFTLEHFDAFRRRWKKAAHTGVSVIQQAQPVRTFNIGDELSFCIADCRMERTRSGFLSTQSHQQLVDWITNLSTPGVLAIPQPLIAGKGNNTDKNLPDWDQYNDIIKAIESGNHDIVVLAGDVHYGRVSQVIVGSSKNKLTEVITSPLSNLSEINGIAANTPDLSAKTFPLVSINGMIKNRIKYLARVTTESKWWDLRYPVERTHEHFMTVAFHRDSGKIKMDINAWHARELVKRTGLPKKIKNFKVSPIVLN